MEYYGYYEPDIPPVIHFETIIDLYEQDFERYYGLDEPEPESDSGLTWHSLNRFAERIIRSTRTMTDELDANAPTQRIWETVADSEGEVSGFLSHRFELAFASEAMWDLSDVASRAETLLGYLTRVENERARAYLHRVATCYLRGLKTETLVMAGAVLEAAMEDACPDESVRKKVPNLKRRKHLNMQNRLDYLLAIDDVDFTIVERARALWQRRVDAVHVSPGDEPDMEEVLDTLVFVLEGLAGVGGWKA